MDIYFEIPLISCFAFLSSIRFSLIDFDLILFKIFFPGSSPPPNIFSILDRMFLFFCFALHFSFCFNLILLWSTSQIYNLLRVRLSPWIVTSRCRLGRRLFSLPPRSSSRLVAASVVFASSLLVVASVVVSVVDA